MSQRTVRTEKELEEAVKAGVNEIIIENKDLVEKVHRVKQIKKVSVTALTIAVPLIVVAVAAAPFTGGLSVAAAAPIAVASGLSASAIVAIAGIIAVGLLVIISIMNDYEEIECSLNPPKLKLRKKQTKN
jgi:hypothetical protein